MHAEAPRSASYTWHSILFGRELLKRGVKWGIGDGTNIRIMGDHWIPSMPPELLQVKSPIPPNATVHCLLDDELGTWNEESVHAFFHDDVAEEIMQLPISQHGGEDYARWPHTKFREFSVRSAYNMARCARFQLNQSVNGCGMASNNATV